MKRFFYALKMWTMGFEFRRAWWFYDSFTGRMLREREQEEKRRRDGHRNT